MRKLAVFAAIASLSACRHASNEWEADGAAIAAVPATMRIVGRDTTWVSQSPGLELIAWSKADLAVAQPRLAREIAALRSMFPGDSQPVILATVRKQPGPNDTYDGIPAVPQGDSRREIDLVLPNPKAQEAENQRDGREGGFGGRGGGSRPRGGMSFGGGDPLAPVVRAWLVAHAAKVSTASGTASRGVPAWIEAALPNFANDTLLDRLTTMLAPDSANLLPLSRLLTMERPDFSSMIADRGGEERRGGGGGMPGGGGGFPGGGRGGMGRGGRGGGMGGGRGGGMPRRGDDENRLMGPMLFGAESALFAKYLSREGNTLIGEIVDAQIAGKTVSEVLSAHKLPAVNEMDADFRAWVVRRADSLNK